MRFSDAKDSYGWVSIIFHWLTALVVCALWFIGDSSRGEAQEREAIISLHVSIGLFGVVLFLVRIFWRKKNGYPKARGVGKWGHLLPKLAHYFMLVVLLAIAFLGLLLASYRNGYLGGELFMWDVTQVLSLNYANLVLLHGSLANFLMMMVLFHMGGSFKRVMFNDDDSFVRMICPPIVKSQK